MCVLNALRGDLKLEMGCSLIEMENVLWVLGVEGVKGLDVKKFNFVQNAISVFPICCHFEILNNTQT